MTTPKHVKTLMTFCNNLNARVGALENNGLATRVKRLEDAPRYTTPPLPSDVQRAIMELGTRISECERVDQKTMGLVDTVHATLRTWTERIRMLEDRYAGLVTPRRGMSLDRLRRVLAALKDAL